MDLGSPLFRLLGDDARLRILRLLVDERLNVTELTGILGIAQSGVSRHLGMLKEAGLVVERREAGYSWYRLAPALQHEENGFGVLWPVLRAHFEGVSRTPQGRADEAGLEEVRRVRKENFEQHGGPDARERQFVPGRSWAAWARALGHLLPPLRVADLGCGEGYLTIEASRWASRVIAVDRSQEVLERARALARRRDVRNITWRRGEIERLPLRDASVDVAVLSQALHHAEDPERALAEAARIVTPGGRVLVLDLREHDQEWVRERLGDRRLGFSEQALTRLMKGAGLSSIKWSVGARRSRDPFTVIIASGLRQKGKAQSAKGEGRRAKGQGQRAKGEGQRAKRRQRDSGRGKSIHEQQHAAVISRLRGAPRAPAAPRPHPGRRDGHHDPAPSPHRGGLPR